MMNKLLFLSLIFFLFSSANLFGQISLNGNIDLVLSKGQEKSHYFYNGIHQNHKDWRVGIQQATLLGSIPIAKEWSLTGQIRLQRKEDTQLNQWLIPQLQIQWTPLKSNWTWNLGRFIHPFGSFYQKQLSPDLTFLETPLAYSYYLNISDRIGHLDNLGENKFKIDGAVEWGQSSLYRYGYMTGISTAWQHPKEKWQWEFALGTRSLIGDPVINNPLQWQAVTRLGWQPTWYWQQGLSFRLSRFTDSDAINERIPNLPIFQQFSIGTDFKIGVSFVEWSGELIFHQYQVPKYDIENRFFVANGAVETQPLQSTTAYLDTKVEPPFLVGSYVAYRLETLQFNQLNGQDWDNAVWRQSIVFGYRLTNFLLFRTQYSWQNVRTKVWAQDTFRVGVTAFF